MGVIAVVIIGLCAGWLASALTRTSRSPMENMIIGVIGAAIGGLLFKSAGVQSFGVVGSLVSATIGSLVLLYMIRWLR